MLGSSILDVIVALVFTNFALSLVISHINEIIAALYQWRPKYIEIGMRNMLGSPDLANKVLNHPLIRSLSTGHSRVPSYIPSNTFALALLDSLAPSTGRQADLQSIQTAVEQMPESSARQALVSILEASMGSLLKARSLVEDWWNSSMDRLSGAYKRRMQAMTLLVAVSVTFILGVDSLAIANYFALGSKVGLVPFVWDQLPSSSSDWFRKILGLLITAFTASLMAPFWFSLMKNIVNLRASGPSPAGGIPQVNIQTDVLRKADPKNVQEVAAAQSELLNVYHNIVLDQARMSFRSAQIAGAVGLVFFLGAVTFVIIVQAPTAALISGIAGSLVEVISGVNFYLYGKTADQMADFRSHLERTQYYLVANSICESLEGEFKQRARSELILAISGNSLGGLESKPKVMGNQ